jgi:hypothetical protein
MEEPGEDAINYITMLAAFQVVLNCQLELQGTKYDQGKSTVKTREAVNMLNLTNANNRNRIWDADPEKAADMMHAIHVIGKQIAEGDGIAINFITSLTRAGLDFSRCVVKELTKEEIEELKKEQQKQ